jgi:hypothetical protein
MSVPGLLHAAICLLLLTSLVSALVVPRTLPTPSRRAGDPPPTRRALTGFPVNAHAVVGGTVTLTCEASIPTPFSRVQWFEFNTIPDNAQMISDTENLLPSHPNYARYELVLTSPTTFNLRIHSVMPQDGGSYICRDAQSTPDVGQGQAELVVLGTEEPICETQVPDNGVVLEGQQFTKNCRLRYYGHLTPAMQWTGPEPHESITIPGDENEIFSGVLFIVDRGMDTGAFRCRTNFTELTGLPPNVATNAPTYEHVFQYNQIFVYWSPKNLYVLPVKPEYNVGDEISCHADAYPSPFFAWLNMRTNEIFNAPTFTVSANMIGENTTVRCQAQNIIQGLLYSANYFFSVIVPVQTVPTTTPTTLPTTTPPLTANCRPLSGWWRSTIPFAEILVDVAEDNSGKLVGYMRNHTSQQWVEVVGRTRLSDNAYIGVTTIWPYEAGVTGMAGECHRCSGVEVIIMSGLRRSFYTSPGCGEGSEPIDSTEYTFFKISDLDSRTILSDRALQNRLSQ